MEQLEDWFVGLAAACGNREWVQRGAFATLILLITLVSIRDLGYFPTTSNGSSKGVPRAQRNPQVVVVLEKGPATITSSKVSRTPQSTRPTTPKGYRQQSTSTPASKSSVAGVDHPLGLQPNLSSGTSEDGSTPLPVATKLELTLPLPIPRLGWKDPIALHRAAKKSVADNVYFTPKSLSGIPGPSVSQGLTHVLMTALLTDHIEWNFGKSLLRFVLSFNRATATNRNSTALFIFANDNIVNDLRFKFSRLRNIFVIGFPKNRELENHMFWISSLRFLLYRLLLQQLPQAKVIMVSDIFDVYFQEDDPLRYFEEKMVASGKGLTVALEDCKFGLPGQPDDGLNERWIRECFSDFPRTMHSKYVSCSGTTVGLRPTMATYLQLMDDASRRNDVHTFKCTKIGLDQGVHNFLVYTSALLLNDTIEEHPTLGRIVTGNGILHWRFDEGRGGALVNALGEPYVIVHQPNRCGVRQQDHLSFWSLQSLGDSAPAVLGSGSMVRKHPSSNTVGGEPSPQLPAERRGGAVQHYKGGPWFRPSTTKQCNDVQWPNHLLQLKGVKEYDHFRTLPTE